MGSILSYILSSNAVAASLFIIIIGVIWSNQPKKIPKRQNRQAKALADKKRSKPVLAHEDANKQTEEGSSVKPAPPAEEFIPGGLSATDVEQSALSSSGSLKKEKKKKGRRSRTPIPSNNPASASVHSIAGSSRSPLVSADESTPKMNAEEAWTRVESRHRTSTSSQNVATSDAGLTTTTSVDDESSSVGGLEKSVSEVKTRLKPQTLAEKMLPKGRKTEVDDILDTPNYPTLSRVMRITSPPDQPATGFSWGDYEDAEDIRDMDADGEDDGGWDVVVTKSRGKAKHSRPSQPDKAVESKTKKQKQNQARREAEKTAKEEGEKQRLELLASHRREMEKAIMDEQSKKKKKKQPALSGGMKAAVDAQGHLVWED